jgi:hypothetical protein
LDPLIKSQVVRRAARRAIFQDNVLRRGGRFMGRNNPPDYAMGAPDRGTPQTPLHSIEEKRHLSRLVRTGIRMKAAMTRLFYYEPFHRPPRRIGPLADKNFIEGYLSQLRPDVVF